MRGTRRGRGASAEIPESLRDGRRVHQLGPGTEVLGTPVELVVEGQPQLAARSRPDDPKRPLLRRVEGG